MKADLLESQIRTLEDPVEVVTGDVTPGPAEVVQAVRMAFGL